MFHLYPPVEPNPAPKTADEGKQRRERGMIVRLLDRTTRTCGELRSALWSSHRLEVTDRALRQRLDWLIDHGFVQRTSSGSRVAYRVEAADECSWCAGPAFMHDEDGDPCCLLCAPSKRRKGKR